MEGGRRPHIPDAIRERGPYILSMTDNPAVRRRSSFVQASEFGSPTGTDGYVPGPLDKALLGGAPQRVGTFEYRYDTDTWSWW